MNKRKKTYGVYNIIEWHAQLQVGKALLKVAFTGGSITTNGVTPATYTTDDPVIQLAIERSREFKSGKIKTVRNTETKEEIVIERNPEKTKSIKSEIIREAHAEIAEPEEAAPMSVTEDPVAIDEPDETDDVIAEEAEEMPAEEIVEEETTNNSKGEDSGLTEVEFSCNDDAKDYLEETFKVVRSRLRNREDIKAAGRANGVEIIFVQ